MIKSARSSLVSAEQLRVSVVFLELNSGCQVDDDRHHAAVTCLLACGRDSPQVDRARAISKALRVVSAEACSRSRTSASFQASFCLLFAHRIPTRDVEKENRRSATVIVENPLQLLCNEGVCLEYPRSGIQVQPAQTGYIVDHFFIFCSRLVQSLSCNIAGAPLLQSHLTSIKIFSDCPMSL